MKRGKEEKKVASGHILVQLFEAMPQKGSVHHPPRQVFHTLLVGKKLFRSRIELPHLQGQRVFPLHLLEVAKGRVHGRLCGEEIFKSKKFILSVIVRRRNVQLKFLEARSEI